MYAYGTSRARTLTWEVSGLLSLIVPEGELSSPCKLLSTYIDSDPQSGQHSKSGIVAIRAAACRTLAMAKKELTLREHLSTIQSKGGKARWANVSPEERSAQARKAIAARWAKATPEQKAAQARKAVAGRLPTRKPAKSAVSSTEEAVAPKSAPKKSRKRRQ